MKTLSTLLAVSILGNKAFGQQSYARRFSPNNLPHTWEQDQTGYNDCNLRSNAANQTSLCQTAWVNSVEDFCIWGPPNPNSIVGNEERVMVAWCTKGNHGTRVIPDGALTGVHFVKTQDYIQVTGIGDLTKINIAYGDDGGELDPHGADGKGNPIGGLVYTTAFGNEAGEQALEWTNFISSSMFCIKVCLRGKTNQQCEHIYDVMGCLWNMPANYQPGFETCQGDVAELPGIYGTSTWYQGIYPTPPAHPAPSSSQCSTLRSISNGLGLAINLASASATSSASASGVSASTSPTGVSALSVSSGSIRLSPAPTSTAVASPTRAPEAQDDVIGTKSAGSSNLPRAALAIIVALTSVFH